ncbi:MAG: NAD-dependent epimerase/dehydratase family protein [Bacteroidota bacterium]|nr:NAD-dependent epimerase/dehydratase family protein [Bacteroidota bacterium]
MEKILIIGAGGQLGSELTLALQQKYGLDQVVVSDIKPVGQELSKGISVNIDVLDKKGLEETVEHYKITQIYHLAAILSAVGEKNPKQAWDVNMNGLLNVLDIAHHHKLNKIFWPSSIAVYGPDTPKKNTPQTTIMNPNTMYGISKLAGERWCEYYHKKFKVDIRSLRYPGLIGYKSLPGGGTTDYAVDIYHNALRGEEFTCFLKKDTYLPMMYIPDAIQSTLQLMDAPAERISVRSSYNISGMSISPEEFYISIKKHFPDFKIHYEPDFRQEIADTWPQSIDDSIARKDWNWKPAFSLESMTEDMFNHLAPGGVRSQKQDFI